MYFSSRSGAAAFLRTQRGQLCSLGFPRFLRWNQILFDAWLRSTTASRSYRVLSEAELRATRRSETVFIFGSGYSLNTITRSEWRRFERHDVFGFSGFVYQNWIRVDYHLIRGWVETQEGAFRWQAHTREFADVLNRNVHFSDTVFLLQGEYFAQFCNQLIGYRFLRPGSRIFRFSTARGPGPPTRSFRRGVRHSPGTLIDVVNSAYLLGWREIVLVGVDLYDSRYFWLKPDETLGVDARTGSLRVSQRTLRGGRYDEVHNTARNGILDVIADWAKWLAPEGVRLWVYNPRSLLAEALPIYEWVGGG